MKEASFVVGGCLAIFLMYTVVALINYLFWGWALSSAFHQLTFTQGGIIGIILMTIVDALGRVKKS